MIDNDKKNLIPRKHKERFERETFKINNNRGFIIIITMIVITLGLLIYSAFENHAFFSAHNLVLNITLAAALIVLTMFIALRVTKIRNLLFAQACDISLLILVLFWSGYISLNLNNMEFVRTGPFFIGLFTMVLMQYHPPRFSIVVYSAFSAAYAVMCFMHAWRPVGHLSAMVQLAIALAFAILGSIVMYEARKQAFINRLMNEQFEKLSLTDSLTNIPNRRYFDNAIQSAWRFCMRESRSITLAMIDIDHFKLYNDTYGHLMGDHCLTVVAEAISRCAGRGMDQIMRYGGEEFVILMPGSDADAGMVVAERARRAVADMRILHRSSPTVPYITISIGLIGINPANTDMSIEDLIKSADEALYTSKKEGRNRVTVFHKAEEKSNVLRFDK